MILIGGLIVCKQYVFKCATLQTSAGVYAIIEGTTLGGDLKYKGTVLTLYKI